MFRKEALVELRSKSGLLTALLFSVAAVTGASFASAGQRLGPGVAASLLWVTLLFAAVCSLPRAFLVEEEQATADVLRLIARPHSVFWGKALFNLASMLLTALILSVLFLTLTDPPPARLELYGVCLIAGSAALAGVSTLCGALVAEASNRFMLAGAIALPLLLPLLAVAVSGTASAFGGASEAVGWRAVVGLSGYAVAAFAGGPYLFAAVWKS